jgi:ankyrin repeat protein
MAASAMGYTEVVRVLLSHQANVNEKTVNGKTALSVAIQLGHNDVADLLRENGTE